MTTEQTTDLLGDLPPASAPEGAGLPPSPGAGTPPPKAEPFKLPDNWRDSLPDDLKNEPSLGTVHDLQALAKSLVHAQKQVGKNKVVIPDKHATEADWREVYHKLGLPEKFEDYSAGIDLPKDVALDAGFVEKFTKRAHEHGVMPKAAKALLEGYLSDYSEASGAFEESEKTRIAEGFTSLNKEWGDAYGKNTQAATLMLKDFADPSDIEFIKAKGLNKDPGFIRLLGKMGAALKEDELRGSAPRGESNMKTPVEAQAEIAAIQGNPKHPYYDKSHPGHTGAVAEMAALFKSAHPTIKK